MYNAGHHSYLCWFMLTHETTNRPTINPTASVVINYLSYPGGLHCRYCKVLVFTKIQNDHTGGSNYSRKHQESLAPTQLLEDLPVNNKSN